MRVLVVHQVMGFREWDASAEHGVMLRGTIRQEGLGAGARRCTFSVVASMRAGMISTLPT